MSAWQNAALRNAEDLTIRSKRIVSPCSVPAAQVGCNHLRIGLQTFGRAVHGDAAVFQHIAVIGHVQGAAWAPYPYARPTDFYRVLVARV